VITTGDSWRWGSKGQPAVESARAKGSNAKVGANRSVADEASPLRVSQPDQSDMMVTSHKSPRDAGRTHKPRRRATLGPSNRTCGLSLLSLGTPGSGALDQGKLQLTMGMVSLPVEEPSVARARAFVRRATSALGDRLVADAAVLATSEVVTRSVLEAVPPALHLVEAADIPLAPSRQPDEAVRIKVEVRHPSNLVKVWVTGTPGRSAATPPPRRDLPGFDVLDALADHWGIETGTDGPLIWFAIGGDKDGRGP